jgi:CheY-like chemotaxis protein
MTENLLISRNELHKTVDTLRSTESSLRTARDAAEASNRAKTEFIANMSHELRTPMNAIIGMSSVLADDPLPDKTRDHIGTIRTSADALLRIIDDILDISKIDAGRLDLQLKPFDLGACISAATAPFATRCAERGIEFIVQLERDLPVAITGDPVRLTQVLNNLLNNAVKFTEHGRVALTVSYNKSDNGEGRIHFSVQDTGVGIPSNRMDLLFKTFSQVDASMTRRFGGTGIGLAIAKHLIDLMGGQIEVESEVGHGSRFFFSIPARVAALPKVVEVTAVEDGARSATSNTSTVSATSTSAEPAKAPALGSDFAQKYPLRILLAEDNPVNAHVAQLLLKRLGYTPDWAINGRKAVENTESKVYDLVFMDLQMPEMDGLDATRMILRTVPDFQMPYIVALTANARQEDRDACAAAGMHDFISKPVQLEKIASGIERAISWRSTRQTAGTANR